MRYWQVHKQATTGAAVSSQTLGRDFTTAYLLTASAALAEAPVTNGIDASGEASDEGLFHWVMKAAIARGRDTAWQADGLEDADSIPPPELNLVVRLPPSLGQCFALRVLESLPRERCAQLLDLKVTEVDQHAGHAAHTGVNLGRGAQIDEFAHPHP